MIALVTGATGLVGSHLVERLHAGGWAVRALVRDAGTAGWLVPLGAELRAGDLLDAAAVGRAARGCDAIFHAAAVVTNGGSWDAYRRANVDGTRAAIDAAAAAGARLLQVSSVAVYGGARYAAPDRAVDEDTPLAPLAAGDYYGRSKREAEALVLDAHRAGRVWATAVRPCVVYGPRDRQFVPRFARLVRAGLVPLVGGGARRFAVVHAANVADAAFRAATNDSAAGRAFVTANDGELTFRRFAELAATGMRRSARFVRVPYRVAAAGVAGTRAVAAAVGSADLAGRLHSALDFVARDNPFCSDLARRELGWRPVVAHEQSVVEAFAWHAAGTGR